MLSDADTMSLKSAARKVGKFVGRAKREIESASRESKKEFAPIAGDMVAFGAATASMFGEGEESEGKRKKKGKEERQEVNSWL